MHIITTIPDIAEYLPGLLSVVPKRPTHPVLANIYLETVKEGYREGIILRVSNLEGFLEVFLPCDVKETGSVCVPAKMFSDILTVQTKGKKKVGTLELSSDADNLISIKTSNASQKLQGVSGHEMPEIPKLEKSSKITVNVVQFINKCDLLSKYVSTDCTKQILQTIKVSQGKLLATDGHKIAFSDIEIKGDFENFGIYPSMIATLKKLNLAKKLADLECEDIELAVENVYMYGTVLIEFNNWKLTWRIGEYGKDLSSIGISGDTTSLEVDRADLISKLKSAIVCSSDHNTKLWLHSQAGRLYLIANNSKDSVETDITDPASFIINAERLLEAVSSLKVKVVKLVLPQSKSDKLMGVEVDGVYVCIAERKRENSDTDILDDFIRNTEFISTRDSINKIYQEELEVKLEPLKKVKTNLAVLEPISSELTIDEKVREVTTHLQSLLATVPDVQLREAIVKEVMAVI